MIENNIENFNKVQVSITLVLVLFLSVTGATFAYFAISESNNNTITGTAATVNLTLTVDKIFPTETSENTGVMVPQLSVSEDETSPLASALKNGCVDANTNVICQVYKIVIQNIGGTATQQVDGSVSFYGNSALTENVHTTMPNLKWKLITSADAATPTNSVLGANADLEANSNTNIFADDLILTTDANEEYYMIIWINETNNDQTVDEGNDWFARIDFNSSNGTGVTSTFTP